MTKSIISAPCCSRMTRIRKIIAPVTPRPRNKWFLLRLSSIPIPDHTQITGFAVNVHVEIDKRRSPVRPITAHDRREQTFVRFLRFSSLPSRPPSAIIPQNSIKFTNLRRLRPRGCTAGLRAGRCFFTDPTHNSRRCFLTSNNKTRLFDNRNVYISFVPNTY